MSTVIWPPVRHVGVFSGYRSVTLSSGGNTIVAVAWVCPRTGSIGKLKCRFTAATGSPTVQASVQGVSTSSPYGPDGTANGSAISVSPTTDGIYSFTWPSSNPSVVAGRTYWLCFEITAGTSIIRSVPALGNVGSNVPYWLRWTGSAWAAVDNASTRGVSIEYSDGTGEVQIDGTAETINTSAGPSLSTKAIGCRFTAPLTGDVIGLAGVFDVNDTDTWPAVYGYTSMATAPQDGTMLLQPGEMGAGETALYATTAGAAGVWLFGTHLAITQGTDYRIALWFPGSPADKDITQFSMTVDDTSDKENWVGDASFAETFATDIAGSFSENTLTMPQFSLLLQPSASAAADAPIFISRTIPI